MATVGQYEIEKINQFSNLKRQLKIYMEDPEEPYDEDNENDVALMLIFEDAINNILSTTHRKETNIPQGLWTIIRKVATIYFNNFNEGLDGNIKSISQGDISITYKDSLPSDIISSLRPYIRSRFIAMIMEEEEDESI